MKNKCEDNVCGGESLDRSSGICFRSGCGDPTTAKGDCGWDEGHKWMQDYGLVDVEKNPRESQGRCETDYTDIPQQCIIGNQAGTGRYRSLEHTHHYFPFTMFLLSHTVSYLFYPNPVGCTTCDNGCCKYKRYVYYSVLRVCFFFFQFSSNIHRIIVCNTTDLCIVLVFECISSYYTKARRERSVVMIPWVI